MILAGRPALIQDTPIALSNAPAPIVQTIAQADDPLITIEERLSSIRDSERERRAEQRIIDEERAELWCEENPDECNLPQTIVPVPDAAIPTRNNCRWSLASWYGSLPGDHVPVDGYHGRTAANGSTFNTHELTLAHKNLPFGTIVEIQGTDGQFFQARVTDRGPFIGPREYDLSRAAAIAASTQSGGNLYSAGVARINICH